MVTKKKKKMHIRGEKRLQKYEFDGISLYVVSKWLQNAHLCYGISAI